MFWDVQSALLFLSGQARSQSHSKSAKVMGAVQAAKMVKDILAMEAIRPSRRRSCTKPPGMSRHLGFAKCFFLGKGVDWSRLGRGGNQGRSGCGIVLGGPSCSGVQGRPSHTITCAIYLAQFFGSVSAAEFFRAVWATELLRSFGIRTAIFQCFISKNNAESLRAT